MAVLDSVVMICKKVFKAVGIRHKFANLCEIWNETGYKMFLHRKPVTKTMN